MFAGQTDGLQGEALGKTWALPWWYPCLCPHRQSCAFMSSRAGLFKVGSTPEIYLVFVLVCVACSHMTFGLMEDQCTKSFPHRSVTLWLLPHLRQLYVSSSGVGLCRRLQVVDVCSCSLEQRLSHGCRQSGNSTSTSRSPWFG